MVFQTARWLYRAGQWLFVYRWVLLIVPLCSAPNRGSFGPTHVLDPGLLCGVLCKLSLSPAQGACPSSSAQLRESALQPRFSTRRQDASSAGLTPSPQWRPALRAALLITAEAWHWGIAWRAFLEVDLLGPVQSLSSTTLSSRWKQYEPCANLWVNTCSGQSRVCSVWHSDWFLFIIHSVVIRCPRHVSIPVTSLPTLPLIW